MEVIGNLVMKIVPPTKVKIKRTLRERFFSLTPWLAYREVLHEGIPDGEVLRETWSNVFYCNQTTADQLRKMAAKEQLNEAARNLEAKHEK